MGPKILQLRGLKGKLGFQALLVDFLWQRKFAITVQIFLRWPALAEAEMELHSWPVHQSAKDSWQPCSHSSSVMARQIENQLPPVQVAQMQPGLATSVLLRLK